MIIDLSLEETTSLKIYEIPVFDFLQQAFHFYPSLTRNIRYIHYHGV